MYGVTENSRWEWDMQTTLALVIRSSVNEPSCVYTEWALSLERIYGMRFRTKSVKNRALLLGFSIRADSSRVRVMMRIFQLLSTKSFVVLLVFVLGCGLVSFVPSPWRDGHLLNLRPTMPEGLTRSQPLVQWPQNPSDSLDDLQIDFDLDASADDDDAPAYLNAEEQEALRHGPTAATDSDRPAHEQNKGNSDAPASNTSARAASQQRVSEADLKLLATLKNLRKKFPNTVAVLENPCIDPVDPSITQDRPDAACAHYALDAFYTSLRDRAFKKPGKTRWLQYGDSLVTGDTFTGEFRRLLQQQFGDGGHGFLFIGIPLRPYQAENIRVYPTDKWYVRTVVRHSETGGQLFGLAGAEFRPADASEFFVKSPDTTIGKTLERFQLFYFAPPNVEQGSFHLTVDGESRQVKFDVTPGSSGVYTFEIPAGEHKVSLRHFSQRLRYYGLVAETSQPGVVVDNLGMVSGRVEQLLKIDEEHWQDQLRLRGPSLVSFFYGVNAASSSASRLASNGDTYVERYKKVLSTVHATGAPASCLVMSLLTRGSREDGKIVERDAVATLRALQQRAAVESGCAFFDTTALVGGTEGIRRWATGTPRLLGVDLAHPTPDGYREIAHQLYANLLDGFIRFMENRMAAGGSIP